MQTVLVVEDQQEVRTVLARMLSRLGYLVLTAHDGAEALALAESHEGAIHVVLTDVVMPGISATDLAARLAQQRLGLRTIFMSGYPQDVLARELIGDDHSAVLVKPFTQADLAQAIKRLLEPAIGEVS